jgi:hypothetical protein
MVVTARKQLSCHCKSGLAAWGLVLLTPALVYGRSAPPVDHQDLLRQAAVYEEAGQLRPTDMRLRFRGDSFIMDRARYRARLAAKLGSAAPIEYAYKDHRLSFAPQDAAWLTVTGTTSVIEGLSASTSPGRLVRDGQELEGGASTPHAREQGVIYEDAYGSGVDLGVMTKPLALRKVVKIEDRERLGDIEPSAVYLELRFELGLDHDVIVKGHFGSAQAKVWDKRATVRALGESIVFGRGDAWSAIRPAYAWDSAGNQIPVALQLSNEDGRLILTKQIPVAWIDQATFPIYADATVTFDTAAVFEAASTSYISAAALDSTHVAIAYTDVGNGSYGTAIVGLISGTTISFPSPAVVFKSATTNYISAAALDSTHVAIAYSDIGAGVWGTAIVGLISGTTISFPSAAIVFESATTVAISAAALDSTHVAIAYSDGDNGSYGTAIVGLVSGTTISFPSAAVVFESANTDYISAAALDSTHVAIAYRDFSSGYHGTAIAGLVSGTTISFPSAKAVFNSANTSHITIVRLIATNALIAHRASGTAAGTAIVASVSGTTVSFPSAAATFEPDAVNYISLAAFDSTHVAIAYSDMGNSNYGTAIVGTAAVNVAPDTPSSLGPAGFVNGSDQSDTTPTLNFTQSDISGSDTIKYRIQIDDTSNFSSPVVDYTSALLAQGATSFTVGQAAGSGSYTVGSAAQTLPLGSYYWRVMSEDNNAATSGYATANGGAVAFVLKLGLGAACSVAGECANGFCVDAVCCDAACGGGASTDCQACSMTAGAIVDGTCGFAHSSIVCRPTAGECDAAETCTGASTSCPSESYAPNGTYCADLTSGDCFSATCNGMGACDQTQALKPSGYSCRSQAGPCDVADTCSGASGLCPTFDVKMPDGTPCLEDGLVCNGTRTCKAGVCETATPLDCNDQNVCTTDSCVEPTGCQHQAIAGCCNTAGECTDGDACTADSCVGHTCQSKKVPDCCNNTAECDDKDLCTVDSCTDPGGTCTFSPISGCCKTDLDCDDQSICTVDTCDILTNQCVHTAKIGCCKIDLDCDDKDLCTKNTCNVATGLCSSSPISGCCNQHGDCDDQDLCTKDTCSGPGGNCSSAPIVDCCLKDADCDDGDTCTIESCKLSTNRCEAKVIAGCCLKDADCDDHNACTEDLCVQGQCQYNTLSSCFDGGTTPTSDAGSTDDAPLGDHRLTAERDSQTNKTGTPEATGGCHVASTPGDFGQLPLALLLGLCARRRRAWGRERRGGVARRAMGSALVQGKHAR